LERYQHKENDRVVKDKFKEQFSQATARGFQETFPEQFKETGNAEVFSSETVYQRLEKPKDPTMGRYAFPVFRYARLLQDKPPAIAKKVAAAADMILAALGDQPLVLITAAGGFLNASVDYTILASDTISQILDKGAEYGASETGTRRKLLVEYSSPNIAKPFGVGHLRSTIIGNSLRRLFRKLNYDVVGINYPGDWGTQFGKMIVAYHKWGDENTLQGEAVKNLLDLYVHYHRDVENNASLEDEARTAFQKLEAGEPETVSLWEKLKEISNAEFERIYKTLGVEFDLVIGESFFNDKMEIVIERLRKDGLTSESQGALIVELDDERLPPALLKKADGATLYMTRDIAGAVYRWEKYHFVESLYVVGTAQADHFKQMLMVLDRMEEAEQLPADSRMTGKIKHIEFGWVRFAGQSMSTRRGNIVFLDDVINQAFERAKEIIEEKNPDHTAIEKTARMIGVGAVIFSQFSVRRNKDCHFVWEEVLTFEGETGPYLQYTHARLCSLLRKHADKTPTEIDYALLNRQEDKRVIEILADFPQAILDAARQYEPYVIASYLLGLAGAFNSFYQRRDDSGRIEKIISDNVELTAARMSLVSAVRTVLKEGLYLLGIESPEEM
jgi:arginyl-tRNA synthetase